MDKILKLDKHYENKWVALTEDKVVGFGNTLEKARRTAEKSGSKNYTFYLVPPSSVSFAP